MGTLAEEIARRRTFAIISHPDAGKTTLTEKLLLYGGAIHLAGAVRARKNQRAATSDWMELEKERGISITSTVLQFEYNGFCINLLDTPGHKDFSEDTYRVLTAVDSAIMVIDAAKGIEERTRKLFEICRLRRIPIFTFMNKLDRPALDGLALLDELEKVLGIGAFPVTWPFGSGPDFRGVYDRLARRLYLFERVVGGAYRAPFTVSGPDDPGLRDAVPPGLYDAWRQEIEMLDIAGERLDRDAVLDGDMTPVFFGSAMTNFGVQLLLDYFVEYAPPPAPRRSNGAAIPPDHPAFSGFVFKVQANMNPKHRDTVAFLRVCSGVFEKDMTVPDPETGKPLRLAYPQKLFGAERESIERAYPGDIVGLVAHRSFRIGDTLATDPSIRYREIPRFPPEVFATLSNPNPSKFKQFKQGLEQMLAEGVIQQFRLLNSVSNAVLLGAVGQLQFEVLVYRLQTEYGAETRLEPAPFTHIRWFDPGIDRAEVQREYLGSGVALAEDIEGELVILFPEKWSLDYFQQKHPRWRLHPVSPVASAVRA
ncbi:MAG: peptide chain release factor 3 [Kiritimatiellae bacterium]|nr:peptide chain release factor 3 [Kiritimatiellia bacterium]MDW8457801.1 peptide chain release factor 3 [Verrucomicrobiota bacterium]